MSPARACPLCDAEAPREARDACVSCERRVCSAHRWAMLGLCHECATEDEVQARARQRPPHPRELLDIKWVD